MDGESDEVAARSWIRSAIDGVYPRYPHVSFLAFSRNIADEKPKLDRPTGLGGVRGDIEAEDEQLPSSTGDIPMREYPLRPASGSIQCRVEYAHKLVCKAGTSRITSQNQCSKTGVEGGFFRGQTVGGLSLY